MSNHLLIAVAKGALPYTTDLAREIDELHVLHAAGCLQASFCEQGGTCVAVVHAVTPLGRQVVARSAAAAGAAAGRMKRLSWPFTVD